MDSLLAVLVSLVGGACGACVAVLLQARFMSQESARYDARIGPIESGLEDLREEWISWQRKRNKRERDARGQVDQVDQMQLTEADRKRAILERARGVVRGIR